MLPPLSHRWAKSNQFPRTFSTYWVKSTRVDVVSCRCHCAERKRTIRINSRLSPQQNASPIAICGLFILLTIYFADNVQALLRSTTTALRSTGFGCLCSSLAFQMRQQISMWCVATDTIYYYRQVMSNAKGSLMVQWPCSICWHPDGSQSDGA